MILVYLEGHNYEYEVRELIKLFFFGKEIKFVEDEKICNEYDILIKNCLRKAKDDYFSLTEIFKNGKIISSSSIESINNIYVGKDDLNKKIKTGIKQSIYEAISKIAELEAPWGILTGVRPVKIVHDLMDKQIKEEGIYDILRNEYKLYPDRARLIIEVAKKQRSFIYPLSEDRFSLYISIPFCPTRCIYCSFPSNSLDVSKKYVDEYTEKLIYELTEIKKIMKNKNIYTVYIGGGTPTAISTENLNKIIKSIYNLFGRENIEEITVEAGRPDTLTIEKLQMLRENYIERISINPQTMNLKTLETIGRMHTDKDVIRTFNLAREIGFSNINMDIIMGLPGEDINDVKNTLEIISELRPENLTVHTLAVKRVSEFRKTIDAYSLKDQNTINSMLEFSKKYAKNMGLLPYYLYRQKQMLGNLENIGYSIEGKECIYNMLIMEERETIIALGAGGVSKIFYPNENRFERVPNVKSLKDYLLRTEEMVERKRKFIDTI